MTLEKLTHSLLDYKNLSYGFFTRNKGVSPKPYNSLNCSIKVNDDIDNVNQNLKLVSKFMNLDKIVKLNQTHSSIVKIINENCDENKLINADGLVTNLKGVGLSILGADCAPIIFYDNISKIVAACHAGWRGAVNNIVESTVACMETLGAKRNNIESVIGPTIQKDSYRIKEDVAQIVRQTPFFKKNNSILFSISKTEHFFDLPLLIKESLINAKVKKINNINIDTYNCSNLFFSHRKTTHEKVNDPSITGRHISIVGMLKE